MGAAKTKKANQAKLVLGLVKERYRVTVILVDGSVEEHENVVNFGPIPNRDLLGITSFDGETVVYPLTSNVRKYKFSVII